jgi:DNA-binding transcriptional ArsR family regulator
VDDPVTTARRVAPILRALADENRLTILFSVAEQGRSVAELALVTGMAPSLVSHHLKSLRETGLVTMQASGRKNIYTLCCDMVAEPIAALQCLADPNDAPSVEGLNR